MPDVCHATMQQHFSHFILFSHIQKYMNKIIIGTKGKENQSWFYYMCYCGKVIVAKEAKLSSLPLPQLAVSNGRWFHLQLFCYLCVLPP